MQLQITKGFVSSIYKEFLHTSQEKDGHANTKRESETFLMVQWLRLRAPSAGG